MERVVRSAAGTKIVQLVTDDPDAARCPACAVVATSGKDWVLTRPRDLPCGGEIALVQWRKRRWRCRAGACPPMLPCRGGPATCHRSRIKCCVSTHTIIPA